MRGRRHVVEVGGGSSDLSGKGTPLATRRLTTHRFRATRFVPFIWLATKAGCPTMPFNRPWFGPISAGRRLSALSFCPEDIPMKPRPLPVSQSVLGLMSVTRLQTPASSPLAIGPPQRLPRSRCRPSH